MAGKHMAPQDAQGGRHLRRDAAPVSGGAGDAAQPLGGSGAGSEPGDAPRTQGRRADWLRVAALVVLFCAGLGIYVYPAVRQALSRANVTQQVDAALERTASDEAATDDDADDGLTDEQRAAAQVSGAPLEIGQLSKDGAAYQYLKAYNESVAAGTATEVSDPWSSAEGASELAGAGLSQGIIGTLSVPSIGKYMPLFLGASEPHLLRGAAVVAGTSAPLGGEGTHCVIASHRGGLAEELSFRDIEDIHEGDAVVVRTPWDTLTYRVVELRVIKPTETEYVMPQEGRDLLTLVTCHPYGHNYQRYLVTCERDESLQAAEVDDAASAFVNTLVRPVTHALDPVDSPLLALERWLRVAGLAIMVAVPVGLVVKRARAGRRSGRG